jgi:hypothetical protein
MHKTSKIIKSKLSKIMSVAYIDNTGIGAI